MHEKKKNNVCKLYLNNSHHNNHRVSINVEMVEKHICSGLRYSETVVSRFVWTVSRFDAEEARYCGLLDEMFHSHFLIG